MKRYIAMLGVAAALTTGGVVVTALPAAADPPPEMGCPPMHVVDTPAIGVILETPAERGILLACKRIGGNN